jgi:hypothetical protein
LAANLRVYWPFYLPALFALLIVLTLIRGLAWQWRGILTASPAAPPVVGAPASARPPAQTGAPAGAPAAGAPAPAPVGAKRPLPPTDEPPPRNTVDKFGVTYDAQGVAVMGLDADPNGVYNVPPGRQVRIGGPSGPLYDVQPDGRLTPTAKVKEWPG